MGAGCEMSTPLSAERICGSFPRALSAEPMTARLPWMCSSAMSSPVKLWGPEPTKPIRSFPRQLLQHLLPSLTRKPQHEALIDQVTALGRHKSTMISGEPAGASGTSPQPRDRKADVGRPFGVAEAAPLASAPVRPVLSDRRNSKERGQHQRYSGHWGARYVLGTVTRDAYDGDA